MYVDNGNFSRNGNWKQHSVASDNARSGRSFCFIIQSWLEQLVASQNGEYTHSFEQEFYTDCVITRIVVMRIFASLEDQDEMPWIWKGGFLM